MMHSLFPLPIKGRSLLVAKFFSHFLILGPFTSVRLLDNMFFSRLSSCVLLALTAVGVSAVPMFDKKIGTPKKVDARMFDKEIGTPKHVSSKRAVSFDAPHFVVYADKYEPGVTGPPPVEKLAGYNVL